MIGFINRLSVSVPRKTLLVIYKSFIRLHLNSGEMMNQKLEIFNKKKLEKVQYKACLAITGAIQETSRQKNYDESSLHTLIKRPWRSKLTFLYKIVNGLLSEYLNLYLKLPSEKNYLLRSASPVKINTIPSRTKSFRKSFFPYCLNEWNNLKPEFRIPKQMGVF